MVATIATTLSEAADAAKGTLGGNESHEITYEAYIEALEILPPVYGEQTETQRGRFWLGEAHDHDRNGRAICLECWEERKTGRYFCRLSACKDYRN
jgi:hypothetical protein